MSEARITKGLDFYKPTMSQLEYEHYPNAEVTFTMRNRANEKLSDYVSEEELSDRLAQFKDGWQPDEIVYLASLTAQDGKARFGEAYLNFIADHPLPDVNVTYDENGELAVSTTGPWLLATFWETVVMSELNEIYFKNKLEAEGSTLEDVYREGDERLSEKIARLKARPDIKFSDFGTRRRFSFDWHKHVIERLMKECPDNFVGTSNIYLANEMGLKPIGTFAHELPMGYAALADARGDNPLDGHHEMLEDWRRTYNDDLSTALTDTFTTDFFFADFTEKEANEWSALRHDSGDPFEFGEKVINFYKQKGIDPNEKTIVFSDGLDIDMIIRLADHFGGRIRLMFGWGTTLTNDLGLKANNFVMKLTEINSTPTVKLSDTEGKHTGPKPSVERYQYEVACATKIGAQAWQSHQMAMMV